MADAVEEALAGGKTTDVAAITDQLGQFQEELKDAVAESETSKNTLLQLLLKGQESGSCRYNNLDKCLRSVKSMQSSQASQGALRPGASAISLPPGITADTVFGIGQVGGVDFKLSINSLFGLVRSLEAKVQVLSDRTKNTGVQFGDLTFASESKFGNAYQTANPTGTGPAGFVDFIYIWQFAATGQANSSIWLMQETQCQGYWFLVNNWCQAYFYYVNLVSLGPCRFGQDQDFCECGARCSQVRGSVAGRNWGWVQGMFNGGDDTGCVCTQEILQRSRPSWLVERSCPREQTIHSPVLAEPGIIYQGRDHSVAGLQVAGENCLSPYVAPANLNVQ